MLSNAGPADTARFAAATPAVAPRASKHWRVRLAVRTIPVQFIHGIAGRMTSLIRERMLVFSPALAATIGLEEAILLHLLHVISRSQPARRAQPWFEVDTAVLAQLLPFWERGDLQRVSANLVAKGVLLIDSAPLTTADKLHFTFNEQVHQTSAEPAAASAVPPVRPRGAALLGNNWRPEEDLLQLLALNHGIPRQFALDQLEDFILYWRERGEVSHAWSSRFRQHVLRHWRLREQQVQQVREEWRPPDSGPDQTWHPSVDPLQIMERSGINREFIEDAVPEFILYWRERGDSDGTWNSKFIAHIRRQWARYSNALAHEQEPRPIAANWQPSEDVYDILRMANIDLRFARELLPEFILFWRDAGTAQRSWNTKFLQHIKYQWATRHHLSGTGHAQQQLGAGATARQPQSAFERLTDRSWAAGLVDGV
jgi:hypothetical protein